MRSITVKAPVNIAVIKYWGKSDENLIIPLNDSISGTLSVDDMCAHTSVACSDQWPDDRMWLNGEEVDIAGNARLVNCLKQIRSEARVEWTHHKLRICSQNNFPTAAGLASSAAGYACLMYSLAKLFGIDSPERISTLARIGSGSACRSVYGGFVHWLKGVDSETSVARQIVDEKYWPEMRVLVLVVRDTQKDTSSTKGMALTVATSPFMRYRVDTVLPERVAGMVQVIKNRDFAAFAELTMKDSNQFHAVCEDTYPPLTYMNDTSRAIRHFCHRYNDYYGSTRVAYTFDAGPNACLYLLDKDVPTIVGLLYRYHTDLQLKGQAVSAGSDGGDGLATELVAHFDANPCVERDSLRYIISTRIGCGPQVLNNESDSLLDPSGQPK